MPYLSATFKARPLTGNKARHTLPAATIAEAVKAPVALVWLETAAVAFVLYELARLATSFA